MTDKLSACPFCGGEADFHEVNAWWVHCNQCHAETDAFMSPEEATEAWNRRAAPSQSPNRPLDWASFSGLKRNVGWTPDDQDLIYTAINFRDDEWNDADEDAGQQIVERLLLAWRDAEMWAATFNAHRHELLAQVAAPTGEVVEPSVIERVAVAIDSADIGHSMRLIRLVDGVHTYLLDIDGELTEFIDNNDGDAIEQAYARIREVKQRKQAEAVIAALTIPTPSSELEGRHTPTPWAARREHNDWEIYPLYDGPPALGEWSAIATCHDQYNDADDNEQSEARANADLIVAAVNAFVASAQPARLDADSQTRKAGEV